jgi:anion-transporting  ArsA/GET3 family ATPase
LLAKWQQEHLQSQPTINLLPQLEVQGQQVETLSTDNVLFKQQLARAFEQLDRMTQRLETQAVDQARINNWAIHHERVISTKTGGLGQQFIDLERKNLETEAILRRELTTTQNELGQLRVDFVAWGKIKPVPPQHPLASLPSSDLNVSPRESH